MSFLGFIFWVYVIGTVISWPIISKWFYENEEDDAPMAIVMGLCVCWFWPAIIPGFWIKEWLTSGK